VGGQAGTCEGKLMAKFRVTYSVDIHGDYLEIDYETAKEAEDDARAWLWGSFCLDNVPSEDLFVYVKAELEEEESDG
jgi:hypothetical protein